VGRSVAGSHSSHDEAGGFVLAVAFLGLAVFVAVARLGLDVALDRGDGRFIVLDEDVEDGLEGRGSAVGVGVAAGPGATTGEEDEEAGAAGTAVTGSLPRVASATTTDTSTTRTASTRARRSQYVLAGSGPTGCNTPLMTRA
jgi:hypothetical protein